MYTKQLLIHLRLAHWVFHGQVSLLESRLAEDAPQQRESQSLLNKDPSNFHSDSNVQNPSDLVVKLASHQVQKASFFISR